MSPSAKRSSSSAPCAFSHALNHIRVCGIRKRVAVNDGVRGAGIAQ